MSRSPRREVLALLAGVKEQPNDDAPRLVLADWLEEHGDASDRTRAEFIRVQCQRVRTLPDASQHNDLASRENKLRKVHAKTWLGALHQAVRGQDFSRGLVRLKIRRPAELRHLEQVVGSEEYAWVEGLEIAELQFADQPWLAGSPLLDGLTSLTLFANVLDSAGALALMASPHLSHLTALRLEHNRIGLAGARALAVSRILPRLTDLDLLGSDLGDEGITAIVRSASASSLTRLQVGCNEISQVGSRAIAAPHLARLTSLGLGANPLGSAGACAIVSSPHLFGLSHLLLDTCELGDDDVVAVTEAFRLPGLLQLDLSRNDIGNAGARALAACPALASLTTLYLESNLIEDAGAVALAHSPNFPRLARLSLFRCPVGADGEAALARRFGDCCR